MSLPTWRARLVFFGLAFIAVVVAAWRNIPELEEAAGVVWGDARQEAGRTADAAVERIRE